MAATDGEGKIVRVPAPKEKTNVVAPDGKGVVKQQPLEEAPRAEGQGSVSAKPIVIGDDATNRIVVVPDQGPPGVAGPPGPPGPEADWDNMPVASAVQKGGIKVGSGLTIDADGVLSAIGGGDNPGGQGDGNLGQRNRAELVESTDGFRTTFQLSTGTALNAFDLILSVGGVVQEPNQDYAFVAPNLIVFTVPPPAGIEAWALILA